MIETSYHLNRLCHLKDVVVGNNEEKIGRKSTTPPAAPSPSVADRRIPLRSLCRETTRRSLYAKEGIATRREGRVWYQ